MQKIIFTLLLLTLVSVSQAGHIYSYDPCVTFQNAGYASEWKFYFMLESGLGAGRYIQLTMPDATLLGDIADVIGTATDGVTTVYAASITQYGSTTLIGVTTTQHAASNVGYSFSNTLALSANTWYTLTVTASVGGQTAKLYDPIQMRTSSQAIDSQHVAKQIIYDVNNVFAVVSLIATPATTLLASVSYPTAVTTALLNKYGNANDMYIDVKPKTGKNYPSGAFYKVTLTDSNYLFSGTCQADQNVCASNAASCTNITLLSNSACTRKADGSQILFENKGVLTDNVYFRIKTQVTNPKYYVTSAKFSIVEYSRNSKKMIYEVNTAVQSSYGYAASVTKVTLGATTVSFLWGLNERLSNTDGSCNTGFYTSNLADPVFSPVKITFAITTALPTDLEFQVEMTLPLVKGLIQEGTIQTNMPSFTNKQVTCNFVATTASDGKITCKYIGNLSGSSYYIAFRAFDVNVGTSAVTYNVGSVTVKANVYNTAVPPVATLKEVTNANTAVSITNIRTIGALSDNKLALPKLTPTVFSVSDTNGPDVDGGAAGVKGAGGLVYSTSSTNYYVFFLLSVKAGDKPTGAAANAEMWCYGGDAKDCVMSGAANSVAGTNYMISMMANSNVLDITSSALLNGMQIKVLNSLAITPCDYEAVNGSSPGAISTGPKCNSVLQDSDPYSGSPVNKGTWNSWAQVAKDSTNGEAFWLFRHTCQHYNNKGYCNNFWVTGMAGAKSAGFQMDNFFFKSSVRNSLSSDQYTLDFVLCARKKGAGASAGDAPTVIASDANLNVQISQWGSAIQAHIVYQTWIFDTKNASTDFIYGVLNWFGNKADTEGIISNTVFRGGKTATEDKEYACLLFRVAFNFNSADNSGATILGVFFDGSYKPDGSINLSLNAYREESAFPSKHYIGCNAHAQARSYQTDATTNTPTAVESYQLQDLNRVEVTVSMANSSSAPTYTNIYIPFMYGIAATTVKSPFTMFVLMTGSADSSNGQFVPIKCFNLAGVQVMTQGVNTPATVAAYYISSTTWLNFQTGVSNAANAFNFVTTDNTVNTGTLLPATAAVKAASTLSANDFSVENSQTITSGTLMTNGFVWKTGQNAVQTGALQYNNNDYTAGANNFKNSAHYTLNYAGSDIFSSVTEMINSQTTSAQSKMGATNLDCVKFTYNYQKWAAANARVSPVVTYTNTQIVCPVDSAHNTASTVTVKPFTAPSDWGATTNLNTLFHQSYCHHYSALMLINKSASKTVTASACTATNSSPAFTKGINNQKITYTFSPDKAVTSTSGGVFTIVIERYDSNGINPGAQTGLTTVGCDALTIGGQKYTCSNSDYKTFTLTATPTVTSAVTISASTSISMVVFISASSSPTINGKYGVQIANTANNVLSECVSTQLQKDFAGNSATPTTVYLTDPVFTYTKTKSARDDIGLTFTTASSKALYSNEKFEFNFGFLNTPSSTYLTAAAMRCLVTDLSGNVDWQFTNSDYSALTALTFENGLTPAVEIPASNWKLRCIGGAAPDGAVSTKAMMYVKQSSTIVQQSNPTNMIAIPWTQNAAPAAASTTPFVLKNKTLNSPGLEADYNFSVTPKVATVPSMSGRVYVSFPYAIAPRLNREGKVDCAMNGTAAYCEFYSERFVKIFPVADMVKDYETSVQVFHVAQPPVLSATTGVATNIYLALDLDTDYSNGVNEFGEISDTEAKATADTTNSLTAMQLNNYVTTSQITRSTGDHQFMMVVPSAKVVKDNVFIISFPAAFDDFQQKKTYTCSLVREGDTTSTNYGQTSCDVLNGRKARLVVATTDAENSASSIVYTLTISNVPTPSHPINDMFPTVMILASYTTYKASIRSVSTQINATAPNFQHPSGMIVANWQYMTGRTSLDVFKGYFSKYSVATLVRQDGQNFNLGFSFIAADGSGFKTLPAGAQNTTRGFASATFRISSLSSQLAGAFVVRWTKSGDPLNIYSPLPPLFVNVREDKCVDVKDNLQNTVDIPIGGYSLPIVYDFKSCIPVTSVTLSLNLTQAAKTDTAETSLSFLNSSTVSKTLLGSNSQQTRLVYRIKHTSGTATTAQSPFAKAFPVFSGTDGASYSNPSTININRVLAPTTSPKAVSMTASSVAGSATLSMTCDQPGMALWVASLTDYNTKKNGHENINAAYIVKNAVDVGQEISTVDEYTNLSWMVYGYVSVISVNTPVPAVLPYVRANGNYSASFWCINQVNNYSTNFKNTSWVQSNNGAKLVVMTLTTTTVQSRAEQLRISVAINRLLAVKCQRTLTEFGQDVCNSFLRILQNGTNNTNATNSTPVENFVRVTVLPQFHGASDNTYTNAQGVTAAQINNLLANKKRVLQTSNTVKSLSVQQYSTQQAPVPPTLATTTVVPTFTKTSISVTLTITNQDGYLYAGAADMSALKPSAIQLMNGLSGNGTALIANYTYAKMNAPGTLVLSGLKERTLYQLFMCASTVITSELGAQTAVYSQNLSTSSSLFGLFGNMLNVALVSMIAMIISLIMFN